MLTKFKLSTIPRRSSPQWQKWCLGLVLIEMLTLVPTPAIAQQVTKATIREILDGGQVYIQNRPARKNDISRLRETVKTAAARAGLLFDVRAGVRLGQNSSLIVGSQCIRLTQGRAMIAGTVGRNGCVGQVTIRPNGTVYLMSLDDQGGQVTVLEGKVEVFNTEAPATIVTVAAGQNVEITPAGTLATTATGTPAAPKNLSQAQLENLAAPLVKDFQVPLPDLDKVAFLQEDQGFATTFLRDALLGREGNFEQPDNFRGQSAASIQFPQTALGTFIRDTNNTGRFLPDAGGTVPIAVDFDAQTISIGGISGIANSAGLSGNNASGTVILEDGQAIRLEVLDVGLQEPPIGQPFRGSLTGGTVRDR